MTPFTLNLAVIYEFFLINMYRFLVEGKRQGKRKSFPNHVMEYDEDEDLGVNLGIIWTHQLLTFLASLSL